MVSTIETVPSSSLGTPRSMRGVIGNAETFLDVYRVIDRVADTNCTVLVPDGAGGAGSLPWMAS